ncbi:UbiE/COQ5 methyltransferase [Trichormus variabilis ATCC 29413]|uniref:UbiE/COQ5 methyltransferase n=2 Tax=Anabaena variabilis TaxID=264691 RepID=Q3MER7_TRIV2|nr:MULTISPECIES: class I SAM-dependent methyltransferase [Nostocaceae]ABA20519.1 UbiE/COQ5 methyltransferase [Trichormus variabilis ATCC 29413]MBC1214665.1 class I SAM-dependent methyltransferase [Trichormus variabilis ARAD]MBC1255305.1 class I SAM-dependent methyltransferase [Trichormus variabilis V5]MBC1267017.1 class I SAM-dependent methyltransferase [Trichormus variabilis FSR]MBC1300837.1 class I SAM-dependent methyltransferase [Trichormus variabilis N2B]
MQRQLEPEVMDSWEEASEYDAMDFTEVNNAFAEEAVACGPSEHGLVLDAGTGTARIPVLICQKRPRWQLVAIDMAENMLQIATQHVQQSGLQEHIRLELVDAKRLPYEDGIFDLVVSNSLVHHLPDPLPFFAEIKRVCKPQGGIFIRDLFRPEDEATMNAVVASIGNEYDDYQKKLFRDSLHAALTLDEVNQLIITAGLTGVEIYQSSDRHWTAKRSWTN